MKTLTTILSLAATLTLTLGCDAEPELGFGEGDIALRPWGGMKLNTSFLGDFEWNELDLNGKFHEHAQLTKVCIEPKDGGDPDGKYKSKEGWVDEVCFEAGVDPIWVKQGEIMAEKWGKLYRGYDFDRSSWYINLDYDQDGALDSTIVPRVESMGQQVSPQGSLYWAYYWTYMTTEVGGLASKYVEQQDEPVAICEKDVGTGALEALANEDLHVDMKSGDFSPRSDTMFVACVSGAVGKVQDKWGYLNHEIGHKRHQTMTRVARADYCGDGTSFTEPGMKLQIEDAWGYSVLVDPSKETEAHWIVGGAAACLYLPRHPLVTFEKVEAYCGIPKCEGDKPLGVYGDEVLTKNW